MTEPFDPEQFRVPERASIEPRARRRPPRPGPKEWFLKGPIPWNWLSRASMAGGKTLTVAVGLWFRAGLTKSREVKLTKRVLFDLGLSRFAVYRGLLALEGAGLVVLDRRRGRKAIVTLLDAPAPRAEGTQGAT